MLVVLLVAASLYHIGWSQEGPLFDAGVGHMFRALASNILDELRGKNVSVVGDLLTKISFLSGGMKQLMSLAESKSYQVFETIKPMVREIMEKGKPKFEKIKFNDGDLVERFAWNSTQIAQFRDLHSEIKGMLKRLEKICILHNYKIS
ncbi:hypothetical protein J6590_026052 [Homalodisca vitripennis]|nr:hypothetical protein J6590_026052 [Homalodisca vitripennis]